MQCPHSETCALYPKLTTSLTVWKIAFCNSEKHTTCARYLLSQQGKPVPATLLPNGRNLEEKTP